MGWLVLAIAGCVVALVGVLVNTVEPVRSAVLRIIGKIMR